MRGAHQTRFCCQGGFICLPRNARSGVNGLEAVNDEKEQGGWWAARGVRARLRGHICGDNLEVFHLQLSPALTKHRDNIEAARRSADTAVRWPPRVRFDSCLIVVVTDWSGAPLRFRHDHDATRSI